MLRERTTERKIMKKESLTHQHLLGHVVFCTRNFKTTLSVCDCSREDPGGSDPAHTFPAEVRTELTCFQSRNLLPHQPVAVINPHPLFFVQINSPPSGLLPYGWALSPAALVLL